MRRALPLILVFIGLAGCHTYAPVKVHVYDASTMQPLKGITVQASSRSFMDPFHPKRSRAVTNDQGDAVVDVCTNYSRGGPTAILWLPDDGYLFDDPMPKSVVDLPIGPVREVRGEPYRVDVPLLPMAEYRRRYR